MSRSPSRSAHRRADQLVRYAPWIAVSFGLAVAGAVVSFHPPARVPPSRAEAQTPAAPPNAEAALPPVQVTPPARSDAPSRPTPIALAGDPPASLPPAPSLEPTLPVRQSNAPWAARSAPALVRPASNRLTSAAAVPGKAAGPPAGPNTNVAASMARSVPSSPPVAAPATRSQPFRGMVQTMAGTTLTGLVQLGPDDLTVQTATGAVERVRFNQLSVLRPLPPESAPELPEHGLLATYFNNRDLRGGGTQRVERVLDFDWKHGAPVPNVPPEDFSGRWEGELEPLVSGRFTLHTESNDGVRLWMDGRLLIDQWNHHSNRLHEVTLDLQAGRRYPLKMEHYEQGGTAVARLFWTPPGQPRSIVPSECLFPPRHTGVDSAVAGRHGLRGTYFGGRDFNGKTAVRIDPAIDFNWRAEGPIKDIGRDNFSVRWTGRLTAPAAGLYTFVTQGDDGVRLWLDDQKLIDAWRNQSLAETKAQKQLEGGRSYSLRLEYFDGTGEAVVRLLWEGPNVPRGVVESRYLSPEPVAPALPAMPPSVTNGPGVLLTGGSFLAGEIKSANETSVRLTEPGPVPEVALVNVAVLRLRRSEGRTGQLPPGRVGLLLQTGEFVEGQFRGMANSKVTLNSVLHGRRTFDRNEIASIALHAVQPVGRFEVLTRHNSRLRADTIALNPPALVLRDSTLAQVTVPWTNVVEIRTAPR